ncbi:MAG: hypothetical protein J5746_09005, partial [Victivallales bacterium]|nr:hypothetical protein [Victivallales bacterium]
MIITLPYGKTGNHKKSTQGQGGPHLRAIQSCLNCRVTIIYSGHPFPRILQGPCFCGGKKSRAQLAMAIALPLSAPSIKIHLRDDWN